MGCKCQCDCGNSEPTALQKKEKAARSKWLSYRKALEHSPTVWSRERAKAYSESRKKAKDVGFIKGIRNAFKSAMKAQEEQGELEQKVLTLGQEVFHLQARLNMKGLPILPLP